jgi:hypothetical protein
MDDNGTTERTLMEQMTIVRSLGQQREGAEINAGQLYGQSLFQQSEAVRLQKQSEVIASQARTIDAQARALLLQELQALKEALRLIRQHLRTVRQSSDRQIYASLRLKQKKLRQRHRLVEAKWQPLYSSTQPHQPPRRQIKQMEKIVRTGFFYCKVGQPIETEMGGKL